MSNNATIATESTSSGGTYEQAADSVRHAALRIHELTAADRDQYRRSLEEWMQLRAQIDRHASGRQGGPESLRAEQEQMGRDLAVQQARLKRLDVAARQLDLLWTFLGSAEAQPSEPTLTDADQSPAAITLRIIQAQEGERQRLAEEIHDGPAQVLTNAIFQVEYLDRVIDDAPGTARAELAFLRSTLREGLDEVRSTIATLRPPVVDLGLAQALADQAAEFETRHGIAVRLSVDGIDEHMAPSAKASVLRIVQEALRNVRKHAAATEVLIGLEGDRLTISDNGRGFDVMRLASGASRNFGLQFMRERADLMEAQLQIESRQGEGTRILLRLPNQATGER